MEEEGEEVKVGEQKKEKLEENLLFRGTGT